MSTELNLAALLSEDDLALAMQYIGEHPPHEIIAPDGNPYIYRWYLARTLHGGCYFHVQVASDPDRGLHDHPWDNMSVILAGTQIEYILQSEDIQLTSTYSALFNNMPPRYIRTKGDVICRKATWLHRLILPDGVRYTMSLFSFGPKIRDWGFADPKMGKWTSAKDAVIVKDGKSMNRDLVDY